MSPLQNDIRTVLFYRDQMLPYSETFILGQSQYLERYRPYYACTSTLGGLETTLPDHQLLSLEDSVFWASVWKTAYKLGGGIAPAWYHKLKAIQPQLLHAHFGFDGIFAPAIAKALHLPLLVSCYGYDATLNADPSQLQPPLSHGLDLVSHRGRFFRERYLKRRQSLFQTAQKIIAISDFIRMSMVDKGCPESLIQTHYVGIDTDEFLPRSDVAKENCVLFVGRLVGKKGVRYLLQAMAEVQQTLPHTRLVLIGDGPLRSELQQLARTLGLAADFLGRQPPTVVQDWMNRAAVFCGPSVITAEGDAEGLGMVFLEAQAMELPVVSSWSGGIPEAVAHEETGLLAREGNVNDLAQALTRLLQAPELRLKFGKQGRQRVVKQFNTRTQTTKLEGIYDQMIADTCRA